MALYPGTRLGGYDILAQIGEGGMGKVYSASDPRLGRQVAIKTLPDQVASDPDRLRRMAREAKVLASLNHPNIATIYELLEVDGGHALVMELVEGPTLADCIAAAPIRSAEAFRIARQIADGLEAAHGQGIVHRDLKPANIKLRPDGVVKILDFGLAKPAVVASGDAQTLTSSGTALGTITGTPGYMSPEQVRGLAVDKRADIWAFGCLLYEMLTGRRAFRGDSVSDTMVAILDREPDWTAIPAHAAAGALPVIRACLAKDVRHRLRDIGDAAFLVGGQERTPGPDPPRSGGLTPILTAGIAAGVILGAISSVLLRPRSDPRPGEPMANVIATQLTDYGGTESAGALAPDGKSFVFVSAHGGTTDLWVRQISGGSPVRLTDDAAEEDDPAYAPDGESIYYTRTDPTGVSIWRVGVLGGQARKVVSDARAPAPAPDRQNIAFYHAQTDGSYQLQVSRLDGSNRRPVADHVLGVVGTAQPTWSPDSTQIAYSSGGLFAPRNMFVVRAAGGGDRQVTKFTRASQGVQAHAWMPDGDHVLVSYTPTPRAMSPADLSLVDLQDGSVSRLTTGLSTSLSRPSLSADGRRFIATSRAWERSLWKVPFGPDPVANGRNAAQILPSTQDPMWTYVTRDGRTILYNNASVGSRNLWIAPIDGHAPPRQVTAMPGDAVMHASLSPDGSRVAFASSVSGDAEIWAQNIDGSDLRQLTTDGATNAWPVWSPGGDWIVFASLREGRWQTRRIHPDGTGLEKLMDGFCRGDWAPRRDAPGTMIVTSVYQFGVRLLDVEKRSVVWEAPKIGGPLSLPMFSPDGRLVSVPKQEASNRDDIWVIDTLTGKPRQAVQFSEPLRIFFRASWVDAGTAFIVNRYREVSHIVLFDGMETPSVRRQ